MSQNIALLFHTNQLDGPDDPNDKNILEALKLNKRMSEFYKQEKHFQHEYFVVFHVKRCEGSTYIQ